MLGQIGGIGSWEWWTPSLLVSSNGVRGESSKIGNNNRNRQWDFKLTAFAYHFIYYFIRWYGENYYWNEITFAHRRTLGNRGNCRALRLRAVPLIRRSIAKCSSFLTNYSKSTAEQKFSVPPNHLSHCFGHFFFNANQFGNSLNC